MKRFSTFLTALGAMLLFGMGNVYGATISHTFSATSGDIDSNISFTTEQNSASSAPAFNASLRLYAYRQTGDGNSLTLIPKNGTTITQVVITANAAGNTPPTSYYIDGAATGTSISWSGVTGTISTISASSSLKIQNRQYAPESGGATTQLHIKSIEVTYTEPACTNPGLNFNTTGVIYKKANAANFINTASSLSAGAVAYSSSKPSVATVSLSTGEVIIAGNGVTVITATQSSEATYCADEAEYTLVVGDEYQQVTQNSQLMNGGEYILVGKKSATEYVALGKQATNNRTAITINVPSDASSIIVPIATAATDEENIYKLKLGGSAGAWTITDAVNSYKVGPATGSGSDNHLKQNDNATWTISITAGTYEALMECTSGGHSTRNIIRYNSATAAFACYASGQNDVYLYATPETISNSATALAPSTADDAVVATKYYNLQGVEVAAPQAGGIYIAKKIHASGNMSIAKEIVK